MRQAGICLRLSAIACLLLSAYRAGAEDKKFSSPEKLVVLKNGASSCGFLARMDGKIYVFTSIHAVGRAGLNLMSKDGKPVKYESIELASDRDIVRLSVQDQKSPAFDVESAPRMDEPAVIATASLSSPEKTSPDISTAAGKVAGIGPAFFSVSPSDKNPLLLAGSPVIDSEGKVLGIVSADAPVLQKVQPPPPPPPPKADPKKGKPKAAPPKPKSELPDFKYEVNWGGLVCSKLSGDIKWIPVKQPDLCAAAKLFNDSRGIITEYLSLMSQWCVNPYAQIPPRDDMLPELKPWLDEHNKKTENNPKYIASIKENPNHFQELSRQLRETVRTDGARFGNFFSAKMTALKGLKLSPYTEFYGSQMAKPYDDALQILTSRYASMAYIYPDDLPVGGK